MEQISKRETENAQTIKSNTIMENLDSNKRKFSSNGDGSSTTSPPSTKKSRIKQEKNGDDAASTTGSPTQSSNNDTTQNKRKGGAKKKRFHQKSRLGCDTCKRRRVKCDESKPSCKNCQHLGIGCVYKTPPPIAKTANTNHLAITHNITSPSIFTGNGSSIDQQTQTAEDLFDINTTFSPGLNLIDLRLMFNYSNKVCQTIAAAGLSTLDVWQTEITELAFHNPFLLHAMLAFSATHLARSEPIYGQYVVDHRGQALRLLRDAVKYISNEDLDGTDAIVATALLLIMDSLANASPPSSISLKSLPASTWIYHVRGAATILTSVWPLTIQSRFFQIISIDLGDLGDLALEDPNLELKFECLDPLLADLYPLRFGSPYFLTLAYLDKIIHEQYRPDFMMRIFSFPALLDKGFLQLLNNGDGASHRILIVYYKFLQTYTSRMKDRMWFLEGVSQTLEACTLNNEFAGGMKFTESTNPITYAIDAMIDTYMNLDDKSITI